MTLEKIINKIKDAGIFLKDVCVLAKENPKALMMLGSLMVGNIAYGETTGRLDKTNYLKDNGYTSGVHKILQSDDPNVSEGLDPLDKLYNPIFNPSGVIAKIISRVPEELQSNYIPLDANLVNEELSLHSENGNPISVNSRNELICSIDPLNKGYDFGDKPITLWERDMNDPNVVYFLADVRKVIDKNAGVIPLPTLNGIYQSEVPYMLTQTSFKDLPSDFDENGIVNMKDFTYLANDWMKTGNRLVGDIADSNDSGLPDKIVDFYDLIVFSNDYLKEE